MAFNPPNRGYQQGMRRNQQGFRGGSDRPYQPYEQEGREYGRENRSFRQNEGYPDQDYSFGDFDEQSYGGGYTGRDYSSESYGPSGGYGEDYGAVPESARHRGGYGFRQRDDYGTQRTQPRGQQGFADRGRQQWGGRDDWGRSNWNESSGSQRYGRMGGSSPEWTDSPTLYGRDQDQFGADEGWGRDYARNYNWSEQQRNAGSRQGGRQDGLYDRDGSGTQQDFRGRAPKGYERSDERIREDICECLTRDALIDASEISVTVKAGVVTLEGTTDNRTQKHRAENLADEVSGVKDVRNQLNVSRQQQESTRRASGTQSSSTTTSTTSRPETRQ